MFSFQGEADFFLPFCKHLEFPRSREFLFASVPPQAEIGPSNSFSYLTEVESSLDDRALIFLEVHYIELDKVVFEFFQDKAFKDSFDMFYRLSEDFQMVLGTTFVGV